MIENEYRLKGNTDFIEKETCTYQFGKIVVLENRIKISLGWSRKQMDQSLIRTLVKVREDL